MVGGTVPASANGRTLLLIELEFEGPRPAPALRFGVVLRRITVLGAVLQEVLPKVRQGVAVVLTARLSKSHASLLSIVRQFACRLNDVRHGRKEHLLHRRR